MDEQSHPSVFVVLVTYNRAHGLDRTLQSLHDQEYQNWEGVICDDASTDGTSAVAQKWVARDRRLTYLSASKNMGMPANLNRGLNLAKGEFIAVLHDGDIYRSDALARWVDALHAHPQAGFVFNAYDTVDREGRVLATDREAVPPTMAGSWLLERVYFRRWGFGSPVYGTAMMRRSALEQVGLPDPIYKQYADVDLWLRICEQYDACYVDRPIVGLAKRTEYPQEWKTKSRENRRIIRRIFWHGRLRHFRDRPLALGGEIIRHFLYSLLYETYYSLAGMRRRIINRFSRRL